VDAIQALLGCTFGKGNLLFRDYGKQVYTFIRRPGGQALRVVVKWRPPEESPQEREAWQRYMRGERGPEVQRLLHRRRSRKLRAILQAPLEELLHIRRLRLKPPPEARLQRSIPCARCGQRVMEGKTRLLQGQPLCIPCYERRCRCRA
jgi:formylmethanofuran dehydrogenase subunit E